MRRRGTWLRLSQPNCDSCGRIKKDAARSPQAPSYPRRVLRPSATPQRAVFVTAPAVCRTIDGDGAGMLPATADRCEGDATGYWCRHPPLGSCPISKLPCSILSPTERYAIGVQRTRVPTTRADGLPRQVAVKPLRGCRGAHRRCLRHVSVLRLCTWASVLSRPRVACRCQQHNAGEETGGFFRRKQLSRSRSWSRTPNAY